MNIRFYHVKIVNPKRDHSFQLVEGELWVKNDRIIYIGDGSDTDQVHQYAKDCCIIWDREIDGKGNMLMPGFKNAHTHSAMTFLRSYADELPLQEWLSKQVFPREAKLTNEDIYFLTILGIMEYLTSGITSNFDMYLSPIDVARAAKDTGFRTVLTSGLNNFSQSIEGMEKEYYWVNECSDLTSYKIGFHAEYTTSLSLMKQVAALANQLKSPVWLHNAETKREVDECIMRWQKTPTQLTNELGMYEYGGGGYHCVWLQEEDIELFKQKKLTIVTNPGSNLKLASGIAPIAKYAKEKIALAIGTDGPASNNCLDMFREMFLCSGLGKIKAEDASALPAEEVLYMATIGGAIAMGLEDCINLEPGQKADIILIDLQQPNMQPENNLVRNLVYSGSKQNVLLTMVNGKILYEQGKFNIGIDPKEIYRKANQIVERVSR